MSDGVYIRQGKSQALNVNAAQVVATVQKDFSLGQCRLARVNVIVAGTAGGFAYDAASLTPATLTAPVQAPATTSTTGGTLAAATYYYKVTALNGLGETIGSNEQSVTTTGTTSSNTISWAAVPGATSYRIYRGTTAGGESTYYTAAASATSFLDTGAAGTGGSVPSTNTANVNHVAAWPNTVGSYLVDMPCLNGILIVPGAGQTVAVSYD